MNLTFHPCFKVKWGKHGKRPSISLLLLLEFRNVKTTYRKFFASAMFDLLPLLQGSVESSYWKHLLCALLLHIGLWTLFSGHVTSFFPEYPVENIHHGSDLVSDPRGRGKMSCISFIIEATGLGNHVAWIFWWDRIWPLTLLSRSNGFVDTSNRLYLLYYWFYRFALWRQLVRNYVPAMFWCFWFDLWLFLLS